MTIALLSLLPYYIQNEIIPESLDFDIEKIKRKVIGHWQKQISRDQLNRNNPRNSRPGQYVRNQSQQGQQGQQGQVRTSNDKVCNSCKKIVGLNIQTKGQIALISQIQTLEKSKVK